MRQFILTIIFSFLCCSILISQPLDSINFTNLSKEQIVDTLLFLSRHYGSVSHEKSSKYATDAMILSENIDYASGKMKAYITMGENSNMAANYVTAMEYFFKAMSIAQNTHSQKDIALIMDKIGNCYQRITDFESASNFYNNALEIYKKLNDRKGIIQSLVHIAGAYGMQNDCDKGLKYYDQALEIANEDNDKEQLIVIYNGIGNCYTITGDYDKSLSYYKLSWEIAIEMNDGKKISSLLNNIGNIYRIKNDLDKAIEYTKKAFQRADSINYKEMAATNLYNLSGIYFEKKDYSKSMQYIDRARKEAEELGYILLKIKIWEQYVKLYQELGQFDKANEYHTLLVTEQNEGQKINNVARIANLQVLYNLAGKQQQVQELTTATQMDKQKIRRLVISLIIISILLILAAYSLYLKVRYIRLAKENLLQLHNLKRKEQEHENEQIRLLNEQLASEREKHELEIEKNRIERQQTDVLLEQITMEKQRADAQLEQTTQENLSLQEDVAGKNRELVSMTMQIQQKNEIFNKLRTDILKLKENLSEQAVNDIVKSIDHSARTDKDWDTFLMHFNNVHTNFFEILQQLYPELTEKDLKQCAYIKMGLSVKEVASLMNISIRAVEKARMKIKAKMNLGTEVNLSVHLQRISP